MLSQPICKQCGQPIFGNYLNALGATWHPGHFLCAGCGRPIGDTRFTVHDGAPYHIECYRDRVAPRCAYCGKPLVSEYLVDAWGAKFCKEHQGQYPICSFCGRLVPPNQQEHNRESTEDIRCPTCRSSAIETTEQAQPIFKRLIQWVNSQGLIYNNLPISLKLVDRSKLARLLQNHAEPHSLGVTSSSTYTQNGQTVRTQVDGVAVLQGLPSTLFQGVTIHELGHVWLAVQGIQSLPLWAEEGFCQLLSYRYYMQLGTDESRHRAEGIERDPHSVYGDGFRHIRALANGMGFQQFVEMLRRTKQLPSR